MVAPGAGGEAAQGADADDLADEPAQVDVASEVGAQGDGNALAAYVMLSVWKTPHGIPYRICDASSIPGKLARTDRKMKSHSSARHSVIVRQLPERSHSTPLISRPGISPTGAPLVSAACHDVASS